MSRAHYNFLEHTILLHSIQHDNCKGLYSPYITDLSATFRLTRVTKIKAMMICRQHKTGTSIDC